MKNWRIIFSFFALVLYVNQVDLVEINIDNSGNCFKNETFSQSDGCNLVFGLKLNANESTDLSLEIFTYNNEDLNSTFVILCVPTITLVNGSADVSQTGLSMLSHFVSGTEFDKIEIDFSNLSIIVETYIEISVDLIVIDRNQTNGSECTIGILASYSNNTEICSDDFTLKYAYIQLIETPVLSVYHASSQIGYIGETNLFEYTLSSSNLSHFSINITAYSLDSYLEICSIQIFNFSSCFPILTNFKRYSNSNKLANGSVNLYIDSIYDTCYSQGLFSVNNIMFGVVFKIFRNASVNKNFSLFINKLYGTQFNSDIQTVSNSIVNITTKSPITKNTSSPYNRVVSVSLEKESFKIYESFNITAILEFGTNFNGDLQFEIRDIETLTSPRIKLWSLDIAFVGDQLPCKTCLEITELARDSSNLVTTSDRVAWLISRIKLFDLNSTKPNKNRLILEATGQVLNHINNTANSTVELYINLIANGSTSIKTAYNRSFIVEQTEIYDVPDFRVSYADNMTELSDLNSTRIINVDIMTKPKGAYNPLTISMVLPKLFYTCNVNSTCSQTLVAICRLDLIQVGHNIGCYRNQLNYSRIDNSSDSVEIVVGAPFCNIGGTQDDDSDGLIRFLFSLRLVSATSPNSSNMSLFARIQSTIVFIDNITIESKPVSSYSLNGTVPLAYVIQSTESISNGQYAGAKIYIKIPKKTSGQYLVYMKLNTSQLSSGYATIITASLTRVGLNIPCSEILFSSGSIYDTNKGYYVIDNAVLGYQICTISQSQPNYNITEWDEDTVEFEIVTKSFFTTLGRYSIDITINSFFDNRNISHLNVGWNVHPNTTAYSLPKISSSQLTSVSVDNLATIDNSFYKGQTIVLRYTLNLTNRDCFNIVVYSGFFQSKNIDLTKYISIKSFHLENISSDYPYPSNFSQYRKYSNESGMYMLNVSEICYYNITATSNMVIVVMYKIAIDFPDLVGQKISFFMCTSSNCNNSTIDKTSNLTFRTTPNSFGNLRNIVKVWWPSKIYVTPNAYYKYGFNFYIPALANIRVGILFQAFDISTGITFGNITDVKAGAAIDVDGFMNDYLQSKFVPIYYKRNLTAKKFIYDSVYLDLGIVTNINWCGYNSFTSNATYCSSSNRIQLEFTMQTKNDLNMTYYLQQIIMITAPSKWSPSVQTPYEISQGSPSLFMASSINSDTKNWSIFKIQFSIDHFTNSSAAARDIVAYYHIPNFLSLINSSCDVSYAVNCTNNTILNFYFLYNLTLLNDEINCWFDLQLNQRINITEEILIIISYNMSYNHRYLNSIYKSKISLLKIIATPIVINSSIDINATLVSLKSKLDNCQISSSANSNDASLVLTAIGWQSDYRSIEWYKSGSTYVKISFGNQTLVGSVRLNQLVETTTTLRFTIFQISYSMDDVAYEYLADRIFPNTTNTYNYDLLSLKISARYLRIHIKGVANPSLLTTKTARFSIVDITGVIQSSDQPFETICQKTSEISPYYKPKSILTIPLLNRTFVCIEKTNRLNNVCFKKSIQNIGNKSYIETIPKTVSNVILWIRDRERQKDYLFGLSNDKKTYIRSDNNGLTWKSISNDQFEKFMTDSKANYMKYINASYETNFTFFDISI